MKETFKREWASIASLALNLVFAALYLFKWMGYNRMVANYEDLSTFKMYPLGFVLLPLIAFGGYMLAKSHEAGWIKRINFWIQPFFTTAMIMYFMPMLWPRIFLWAMPLIAFVVALSMIPKGLANDKEKFLAYVTGSPVIDDKIDQLEVGPGDFVGGKIFRRNRDENGDIPDGEDPYVDSGKKAVLPLHDRFVHMLVLGVTGSGKTSQTLLPMMLQDFVSDNFRYEEVEVVQMGQIVLEPKSDLARFFWAIGKLKEKDKRVNYMKFLMRSRGLLNEKIEELRQERQDRRSVASGQELSKDEAKEFSKLEKQLEDTDRFYKLPDEQQIALQVRYEDLREKRYGRELTDEELGTIQVVETGLKKLLMVKRDLPNYLDLKVDALRECSTFALFQYSASISYILANPAICDEAWNDIIRQDPKQQRDPVLLFDPQSKKSPYFNPMFGPEDTAVGTVTATLLSYMADSSEYFKNTAKAVVQNAIRVAKRVYQNDAHLMHVNDLLNNTSGRGELILKELGALEVGANQANQNRELRNYFLNDYYSAMKGLKGATKTYEHSSGIRSVLNNLLDNSRIRRVLCPPAGVGTGLDFDRIIRTGDKVAISTQTGVSEALGAMLGSFIMLQLQDAIGRRKGKENTRNPAIVYIDEAQDYVNSTLEASLTKGRSFVVGLVLATQTLGLVEEKAGKGIVENLKSNARNRIIYPGGSVKDIKEFEELFGYVNETREKRSISQEVEKELNPYEKAKMELGLSEKPPAKRESISTETKAVERFSQMELQYGPMVEARNINSNTSFSYIFYRFISKNSVQVPGVAQIEYIPRELKVEGDKLIKAYESVIEKEMLEELEELARENAPKSSVDALGGVNESVAATQTFAEINAVADKSSDPSQLARDAMGGEFDFSEPKIELEDLDLTEVNAPSLETVDLDFNFDIEL